MDPPSDIINLSLPINFKTTQNRTLVGRIVDLEYCVEWSVWSIPLTNETPFGLNSTAEGLCGLVSAGLLGQSLPA